MRYLPRTQVIPEPDLGTRARELLGNPGDTVVLGRQADTAVANGWDDHVVLNTDDWSRDLNDEWVRGAIDYQRPVYSASPPEGNMVQTSGRLRWRAHHLRRGSWTCSARAATRRTATTWWDPR